MIKKIICTVMALVMLTGVLSLYACGGKKGEKAIMLADSYSIVAGDEMAAVESIHTEKLSVELEKEGIEIIALNGPDAEKAEFEILVGDTGREESNKALEKLGGADDFIIDPISTNCIVICGKTPLSTECAVDYFLDEYVKAGTDEFEGTLLVAGEYHFAPDYKYESVVLEDVAIKDYVIATEQDASLRNAYRIAHYLGSYSGELPKIVNYSELTSSNRGVVCYGSGGRAPKIPTPKALDGYFLNLETNNKGATIAVTWSDEEYIEEAVLKFGERFATSGEGKVGEGRFMSITKHDQEGVSSLNETEWIVVSEKPREVTKGVTQVSYTCKGYNDLPYLVHVMTVDLDYVSLMLGTADNNNKTEDKWVQTPAEHARAAIDDGFDVVGAINAGYPTGLSVKEGVMMVPGTIHRPYFAVTKAGVPFIGYDDNAADIENIELAACGTDVLVDNYMPGNLRMTDDFAYTTHPRTMIGIRGDGKIVMVVIDGRQPELSNGAPFTRCADIMMRLGCKYALNLDGGGSSCMIVRHKSGAFQTVNKISDPTMRAVRNSIMIVAGTGNSK